MTTRVNLGLIPGSMMLVPPEKRFCDDRQVELFHNIMNWFFGRCMENTEWHGEAVHQPVVTGTLDREQARRVFMHLDLYIMCAGCGFTYSEYDDGQWVVGVAAC